MKKYILWLFLLCICPFMMAQNFQVLGNSYQKVAVLFDSAPLSVEEVSLPQGVFSQISMENCGVSNNPGAPQLPQLTKLLQIPVCDSVRVTIVDARCTDYAAADLGITHSLYPSQPSVSKSATNPPFVYDQTVYNTNDFYALPLVSVEKAGIWRGNALANVYVSPVQYNPVSQTVRIYSQIEVEFTFVNTNMSMTHRIRQNDSPLFTLQDNLVINPIASSSREITSVPIKYLIVANSMFANNTDLEAFITWKRRLGYLVEVAYTSDANVGTTTTSIKNFIQGKYDNATADDPAPAFLLLIGDVAQLPAFTGVSNTPHVTDLYYATLTGDDILPDCYYGRLSATNNTQLSNQIAKIMMYEQYSMPDPSYLGNAVLIAGTDGNGYSPTYADGQVNYIYDNYVNTGSTTHNYTTVYKHNYNCSSQEDTIREEINAGVGLVNYTAHGSPSGWSNPAFSSTHVSAMTNANKYGLLIGNCCRTGKFNDNECFGESLLRAANKGAMGYIGASDYSYWNEDFYWAVGVRNNITANVTYSASELGAFDKIFHTHGEAYSNWVSTIGGMLQGGNLSIQASSSVWKLYYWEIYHCFGDPSVRVYLGIPSQMAVNADDTIAAGSSGYTAQVAPYAYVALTSGGNLVAAAYADANGNVTLSFPESLDSGVYELAAIAQNYIPYFQAVEVLDAGTCLIPSNLTFSNMSPFSATMTWTGASGVYNIEIKEESGNWTPLATGITTNSYALTNLQENTSYQVRVQADCGGETSLWKSASFTTPVACPIPTYLSCSAMTATTAILYWNENGSANSWTLQYSTDSSFAVGTIELTLNETTVNLLGLFAENTYYARVRANCGGEYGESQWSTVYTFLPTATVLVEIGNGSNTSKYLPSYSYYNYSLTQQLYAPAEIGSAGIIKSIAFYNRGSEKTRTYDMYLVNTNKTEFVSNTDWIAVTDADKVFSGTVTMIVGEWTTFTLDSPFVYDGTSNLALIMDDNTGSYSNGMQCEVFNSTSNCAIYNYSDNTDYDPSSPSGYSGSRVNVKNHIKIGIVPSGPHIVPTYVTISGNTVVCPDETTTLTASSDVEGTYTWSTGASGPQITVGAGTYTVTMTSATEDQLSETVTVITAPVYDITTIVTADSCYTWNGETYCETGVYTQTFETVDGCDSVVTLHFTITVGIDDYDFANAMMLYPNPTSDLVNVQLTMNNEQLEEVEIQLFDVYGRLLDIVETGHAPSPQTMQINLSQYAKGVYFVKAVCEGKTIAVRKVVRN